MASYPHTYLPLPASTHDHRPERARHEYRSHQTTKFLSVTLGSVGLRVPRAAHDIKSHTRGALVGFILAFLVYLGTGIICVYFSAHLPPNGRLERMEQTRCLALYRNPHHSEVRMYVGTPLRELRLLVRMDASRTCARCGEYNTDTHTGITVFKPSVLHSSSLRCAAESSDFCSDVTLLSRWKNASNSRLSNQLRPVQFFYGERYLIGTESIQLGLDGEIVLCRGVRYMLGAQHMCALPASTGECVGLQVQRGLDVTSSVSQFTTTACALRNAGHVWADSPAAHKACKSCTAPVRLWPAAASVHSNWLGFSASQLTDALGETDTILAMRAAIESGEECVQQQTEESIVRARHTFEAHCRGSTLSSDRGLSCDSGPVVSQLRTATQRVDINIYKDGNACIRTRADPTLLSVMASEPNGVTEETNKAWLRLGLMLLAAAIMWVQREATVERANSLFGRCIQIACDGRAKTIVDYDGSIKFLGLLAATARLALACASQEILSADARARVVYSEIIAGSCSIGHWCLLYINIGSIKSRGLRPALGGSSAMIDATSATILAFSRPPIRADAATFDVIARLLTSVMLCVTCVARCMFSAACGGSLFGKARHYWLGLLIVLFWNVQTASIAIVLIDLFAVPLGIDWNRTSTGDALNTTLLLFLAISSIAGIRLTANATILAQKRTATTEINPS